LTEDQSEPLWELPEVVTEVKVGSLLVPCRKLKSLSLIFTIRELPRTGSSNAAVPPVPLQQGERLPLSAMPNTTLCRHKKPNILSGSGAMTCFVFGGICSIEIINGSHIPSAEYVMAAGYL